MLLLLLLLRLVPSDEYVSSITNYEPKGEAVLSAESSVCGEKDLVLISHSSIVSFSYPLFSNILDSKQVLSKLL